MVLRRLLVVAAMIGLMLGAFHPAVSARGAGAQNAGQVEGVVHAVFPAQGLVILTNGMDFRASDPRLLQQVQKGSTVRIDFVQSDERRHINSIVVTTP